VVEGDVLVEDYDNVFDRCRRREIVGLRGEHGMGAYRKGGRGDDGPQRPPP